VTFGGLWQTTPISAGGERLRLRLSRRAYRICTSLARPVYKAADLGSRRQPTVQGRGPPARHGHAGRIAPSARVLSRNELTRLGLPAAAVNPPIRARVTAQACASHADGQRRAALSAAAGWGSTDVNAGGGSAVLVVGRVPPRHTACAGAHRSAVASPLEPVGSRHPVGGVEALADRYRRLLPAGRRPTAAGRGVGACWRVQQAPLPWRHSHRARARSQTEGSLVTRMPAGTGAGKRPGPSHTSTELLALVPGGKPISDGPQAE